MMKKVVKTQLSSIVYRTCSLLYSPCKIKTEMTKTVIKKEILRQSRFLKNFEQLIEISEFLPYLFCIYSKTCLGQCTANYCITHLKLVEGE